MKKIIFILIASILMFNLAFVDSHENFTEAKKLVDEKISCDNLIDEQIEEIGDYLMELMHPGEAHIQMHDMMGGEDSETVKSMHINMAKMMYCNNGEGMDNMMNMMSSGMMNGMMGGNMMAGGMMDNNMMGGMGTGMATSEITPETNYRFNIFTWLYFILLISLIVMVFLIIARLIKGLSKRK